MAIKSLLPGMQINNLRVDPLSEIRNAGIITNGSVIWTKAVADTDYNTFAEQVGWDVITNTVQAGVDKTRNDRNDYVMVVPQDANAVYSLGTALDLNKDRVHLLGVGYGGAQQSYQTTIRGGYGTVPDTQVLDVTGDGCEIAGLRFLGTLGTNGGGTMSNGVAFIRGLQLWSHDCTFEDSTDIWGTPPVVRGGGTTAHDARFDDCLFVQSGTGNIEAAANSALVIGGDGNKRWNFNDCQFSMTAGSTTETMFKMGTGATVRTTLRRCEFRMVNGTAFAQTSAIRGSITANNPVICIDNSAVGFTQQGTDPNVWKIPALSGTRALIYDPGLAIGTAALVAA